MEMFLALLPIAYKFCSVSVLRAYVLMYVTSTIEVSKGAKIRNRYNQVPHLTQDTNGKPTFNF